VAAEGIAKVSESGIGDHGDSERKGIRGAVDGLHALVGEMTTDLRSM
jgi:hypothetical protein